MSQNNYFKPILLSFALSVVILFLIPMFFLARGSADTPTTIIPPPPMANPLPTEEKKLITRQKSAEFVALEKMLAEKGTTVCSILKTVYTRKSDNLKSAMEKYPTDDMRRGSHIMQLNQADLTTIREKYDLDTKTMGTIFRVGLPACK